MLKLIKKWRQVWVIKSILFELIKKALNFYVKYEKDVARLRCMMSGRNAMLETAMKKIPKPLKKYAMWRMYRMAYWDYPLETIICELTLIRGILKGKKLQ